MWFLYSGFLSSFGMVVSVQLTYTTKPSFRDAHWSVSLVTTWNTHWCHFCDISCTDSPLLVFPWETASKTCYEMVKIKNCNFYFNLNCHLRMLDQNMLRICFNSYCRKILNIVMAYKDFKNNSYHTFSFQVCLGFFHKSNKIYLQRLTYLKQWIECCEKIVLVRNERKTPMIMQTREYLL